MRRFYKDVSVSPELGVLLDKRTVRTPLKAILRLPTPALAEAVAGEWREQGETIDPLSMPLTRLANTAIDRVSAERDKIRGEIVAFAGSDLVCYRAEGPPPLAGRQAASWDPVVDWARRSLDAPFLVTAGVMHVQQPAAAMQAFAALVAGRDDFVLAVLHNLATLTGSGLLAAMLEQGEIAPDLAWQAAHVDEDWQIEQWGEDEEAMLRRARRRQEFDSCLRFLAALH